MTTTGDIDAFLEGGPFAVAGASRSRDKYGNKALRAFLQAGRAVYAINPSVDDVEGERAWPTLASLPEKPHGVSIVTPPRVTLDVVTAAIELGIPNLWMQPGAESAEAVRTAEEAGVNVIHSGPCILVVLRFTEG